MGAVNWQIDIDGKTHHIEVEHRGRKGWVWANEVPVMEWKIPASESSHHLTRYQGRLLGIHLYEDPRAATGWRYDCSLDGMSVVTGNSVWIQESTPYDSGYRRWDVDLCGHRIPLGLRHKSLGSILLEINGEPVTTLQLDIDTPNRDYFLPLMRQRVGFHIREAEAFSYRYDCSVNGQSVTTGQPMAAAPLLDNYGGFAWVETWDGLPHLFRVEHRDIRNRVILWVDGEKVGSSRYSLEEEKEHWHSFRWLQHHVMIRVRELDNLHYEYLPVMNGRSVITGEAVQPPEMENPEEKTQRDMWDLSLSDGSHRVEIVGTFSMRICVDGVEVARRSVWDEGDSWHPFTIGNHSCAMLFLQKTFTYQRTLFVDGIDVATGNEGLPLKVIPSGRQSKWWMFRTSNGIQRVELRHRQWWGHCEIRVNEKTLLKKRQWDREAAYSFTVDGEPCQLHIAYHYKEGRYLYHLWVNHQRVETGKLVPGDPDKAKDLLPSAPSWRQRLRSGVGVYLLTVAVFLGIDFLGNRLGWDPPQSPFWYFLTGLYPALAYTTKGTQAEKWLLVGLVALLFILISVMLYFRL